MIDSKLIKFILMCKFRYKDGLLVTSECGGHGHGIADIITYNHKKDIMVEIEIKISKQDLKKDLDKMKHILYSYKNDIQIQKFYYAVPSELVEYCTKFLLDNNLDYGIIEIITDKVDNYNFKKKKYDCSELVRVAKQCKKFNNNKPTKNQVITFLNRLSSELILSKKEVLNGKIQSNL